MTARTPNEQRIEALEAEVVTIRLELQEAAYEVNEQRHRDGTPFKIFSALAASTDYANKVVVNQEEWEAKKSLAVELCDKLVELTALLDSLRKADAATDAEAAAKEGAGT